jgi:hypothetical protein
MATRRNQYQPSTYLLFDGVAGSFVQTAVTNIVPNASAAFSASVWLYLKPFGTGSTDHIADIIGNRRDSVTQGWIFKVSNKAQQKGEFTFFDQNTSSQGEISNVTVPSYRWTHLGVSFDGRNTTFYIDGNPDVKSTLSTPKTITEYTGQNIRIGHRQAAGSTFETFSGAMSQLAVWDRALTADEFATIYNTREIPQTNLLAYWAMNEGTGTTITDTVAGVIGTLTGGVTWATTALNTQRSAPPTTTTFTNSVSFNGTSDYINVPDNNAYSYATNNALSISVWVNPATLSQPTTEGTGYVHYLSKLDSGQNEWAFRMYSTGNSEDRNNRMSFYMFALAGGLGDGAYVEDKVNAGEWIHFVATVDASKNIKLYKNGVLRDVFLASSLTLANGTAPVRIGRGASSAGSSYFQGTINGVQMFNYVLTPGQVQDLYNSDTVQSTGQVGNFKIDEGSGTVIADSSATANNGTLSSGTWISGWTRARRPITTLPPTDLNTTDKTTNIIASRRLVIPGKSLALASASSQYASIANASQVGLDIGTNDFMFGGWYYIKVGNAIQVLDCKYSGSGYAVSNASNIGFDFLYRGDQASRPIQFRLTDGTTNATCSINNNLANVSEGWNHIIVYGNRDEKAHFIVNGIEVGSATISTVAGSLSNSGAYVMGTREDATVGFMNGYQRNKFFYVFTAGLPTNIREICDDIYKRNVYSTTGLVSKWSFNDVATDSIGINNLTLTGSPSYSTQAPMITRSSA